MIKQAMLRDEDCAIYFMMKYKDDTVKVLRIDPRQELGLDNFVKVVFTLKSSLIYFLLHHAGKFYIMDDQKKVHVLKPSKDTSVWNRLATSELSESDADGIVYSDFSEYTVSEGVLYVKDKMCFLDARDNTTLSSIDSMPAKHEHIRGPIVD